MAAAGAHWSWWATPTRSTYPHPGVWSEGGFPGSSAPLRGSRERSREEASCPPSPEPNPGPQSWIQSACLSGPQFPHLSEGL